MLSWRPRAYVKDGVARYCAPGCGANCTRAAHDRVDRLATHMAVALGAGWRKRLSENMGWFASVSRAGVDVHASAGLDGVTYSARYLTWNSTGHRTPRAALRALLRAVRRDVARDQKVLDELSAW